MTPPSIEAQFLSPDNWWQAWEKVRRNAGCAGIDGETVEQFGRDAERNLKLLRQALLKGTYRPLPLRRLWIPKNEKDWRPLGVPTVRDRIVQQALLLVLHPVLDPQFENSSFAYRPGRSHQQAVIQVTAWGRRGYEWVLDADIVKYFDNVGHDRLLSEVRERLDYPRGLELIEDWIEVGTMTKSGLVLPEKGIPQGAVVSPILANVYLDDFDEYVAEMPWKLVRYADDFLVLGRNRKHILQARDRVAQLLDEMGLELHPKKTQITTFKRGFRFLGHAFLRDLVVPVKKTAASVPAEDIREEIPYRVIHADAPLQPTQMQSALVAALRAAEKPIPPPLMVALGYKVRGPERVKIASRDVSWQPSMSTLYLLQQGTVVRKEKGQFSIRTESEETTTIPIREIECILVFGNIQLSSTVIATCLHFHIPVIFLSQVGEYKGHLWSAEFPELEVQAAQFTRRTETQFQLETARAVVRGKLLNSKQLLLRANRKRHLDSVAEAISGITSDLKAVSDAAELPQLRGYEGVAAARYFGAFGELILHEGFEFNKRARRPPPDPLNSLLSFGYTLLFNNVLSSILAEGLNPYLGNLHGSERKEQFLAFDLMEEFRSSVVDSLVLTVVNKKTLRPTDFTWPDESGGIYLTSTAKRIFLDKMEDRLGSLTAHPDVSERVSYRRVIQLQVRRYKRCVKSGEIYEPFLRAT